MKVYIVTFWWYEEMSILGVFRNKDDAETCKSEFLQKNRNTCVIVYEETVRVKT